MTVGGNFEPVGGKAGATGILARRFGGRRRASQYTSSARFGVKFGAHGRFGEQSGAAGILAGISGVQPGAAELAAELSMTENGVYENGDNFCVRTPILANLGFLKS